MSDGTGLAEALLGLNGFRVLDVSEGSDELVVTIETTTDVVGCGACGTRAEAQDRKAIDIRDLACFGRPARLCWVKRRWRCVEADCEAKTWTERSLHVDAQAVLTRRAGAEACRQVGEEARAVSKVAAELGGHRGRKHDPPYRIRKLLLAGNERLDERGSSRLLLGLRLGDPHDEVLGAWLAKESVRDVYLTEDPAVAATLLDKAIAGCTADEVEEIRSLGNTLSSWRREILAHHQSGASNGPTEGLNLWSSV
jgi:transposase